ncbi:MAG: adenosylhomocysteinase, partial [Thermoproteales archaeon]|nr:adenosylhomocysteinase [Thermoproteales archaeon]
MDYQVRDLSLAPQGRLKIDWAEAHMPVLARIKEEFARTKPLEGVRIGACLHVTKETAVLVKTLMAGGAEVYLAACNPLSTQDDVAAALVEEGVHVYAWRGMSTEEYYDAIARVIAAEPMITMDDGGDLTALLHKLYYGDRGVDVEVARKVLGGKTRIAEEILGGTEETTTGVHRLRALAREGRLLYPVIAVNESRTKFLFDNRYGTGQSSLDGIMRATNLLIAGKTVVVVGYGWVGRGIAMRARGLGARVVVVEVDPVKALEAYYDGFYVTNMSEAAKIGDIFITATGNRDVIRGEHMAKMKDGA